MRLSKSELRVLEQIANGNKEVSEIAQALKRSNKQIYVIAKKLSDNEIIKLSNGRLEPKRAPYVALLLQLLSKVPNLPPVLADSGIPILISMLRPVTLKEIMDETGFKRATIFKKLKQAKMRSIVKKNASTYELNEKLWSHLKDFLEELKEYESTTDERIPASAVIYYKKGNEIVFSSKEELDATLTAFSAYEKYGIGLLTVTNYYYLPKRKLTKNDILMHSIYVAEKDKDIRNLIFIALFYAKFKKEFKIKHPILMNLSAVLAGGEIKGYPKYEEIKDRAEVYGIEV